MWAEFVIMFEFWPQYANISSLKWDWWDTGRKKQQDAMQWPKTSNAVNRNKKNGEYRRWCTWQDIDTHASPYFLWVNKIVLCFSKHYREYLVSLINGHSIDPALLYALDELIVACRRYHVDVTQGEGEDDRAYFARLKVGWCCPFFSL